MNGRQRIWVKPLNNQKLLLNVMQALAGNAHLMVEGDITDLGLQTFDYKGKDIIAQQGGKPLLDMRVFSLEAETVLPLFNALFSDNNRMTKFVHIQIGKAGHAEFVAGDYFHPECVSVGPAISPALLAEWRNLKLILV